MLLMSFIGPAYEEAGEAENTTPLFDSDSDSNSVSGIESCASFHHLRKTKNKKPNSHFTHTSPPMQAHPRSETKQELEKKNENTELEFRPQL